MVKRGDVYYVNLPLQNDIQRGTTSSVQAGFRQVVVTSCHRINEKSSLVIVAAITSILKRPKDKMHVVLPKLKGLPKQSMVLAEQRMTIPKTQLGKYCCTLNQNTMRAITRAIRYCERPDELKKHKGKKGKKQY